MDMPPERLVTTGPYGHTRNPIYLGHIIFLIGMALFLNSIFAALLTVVVIIHFHSRVKDDEKQLGHRFGGAYASYIAAVKRWIPGLF
jgi:protein-S-isoprenylcysteine O-methyltransferase Ste14